MDEKIVYKLNQMKKMLSTLEEALTDYSTVVKHPPHAEIPAKRMAVTYRDSVIKRFEYCTEGFWKLLKAYLQNVEGMNAAEGGPKTIARTAALYHLITEQESRELISMVDARNNTAHMYKEEVADGIAAHAPKALVLMERVVRELEKECNQN